MTLRIQVLGRSTASFVAVGLALSLSLAPLSPAIAAGPFTFVQPSDADMSLARIEYDKGENAYRLGQFEVAAKAFERAYEKSELPDILYNIGLSHLRWYDIDADLKHLRKAKVVFQNYVIEIQKNPELGDLQEAETLIKQIDEKIAAAEAAEAKRRAEQAKILAGKGTRTEPIDLGPDPGKKLRRGGAIAMGIGGAFIVGGVVSGVVLGVRGQEFEEKLANAYGQRDDLMCSAGDARPECQRNRNDIDINRSNGRTANSLSVALGLTFGGLGLAGIVTGAVLFIQGNKKTKKWEERRLSVAPRWSGDGVGLSISGRF